MFKVSVVLLVMMTVFFTGKTVAQDTLPRLSVINQNGKAIISWTNAYGAKISNINIQRSTDSIKRFVTIGTVLNPLNKENGYVDMKMPAGKIFYRVFVAFEGGDYVFTRSYKPVIDTSDIGGTGPIDSPMIEEKKEPVKPPVPTGFVPSKFVYTGKDNNVIINLPDADKRKFSIKFFEENETPLFEIESIKEPYLILERVNFLHAGWFKYHLLDNGIVLEKFKFYISKEAKTWKETRNR